MSNEFQTYTVKAYSDSDGDKHWFLNGKLDRNDGPAVEDPDGTKEWYLNGFRYTEEEFNKKMSLAVEWTNNA